MKGPAIARCLARLLVISIGLGGCGRGCGDRPQASDAAGPELVRCAADDCPRDPRPVADGGRLRVHVDAEPAGLCDLVNHEAWVRWIIENQVMETLIEQDPGTGALGPRLAERWESTGDGATRRIVFHLRGDVRFHDGHPLTSADVAFSLERARDPALGADQRSDLAPVASIETPDPRTVVLAVPRPAPFLLQTLAHLVVYPAHLLEHVDLRTAPFCRAPVGSGPFRVGQWESGVQLSIERAPNYWGTRAHLDGVDFRFVRDRQAAWLLYARGELDLLPRIPPLEVAAAEHDRRLAGHRLYAHTPRAFFFLVWNTRRPALASPKAREALARLVDLPRLVQIAFGGHARSHSGPYVEGTPSYDATIVPWPYDPAAAKAALATLPAPPRQLTFLSTAGAPAVEQLGTLLEEDLRRVGIALTIEKVDFARLLERLHAHDFDVAALQLTLSLEQDNRGLFHSSAADEQNWAGYADAEVDALLDRIAATEAPDARHALDRELHRLLHERGPMTFLLTPEIDTAVAPGVGGVRPSSAGFDLEHAFRVKP